MHADLASVTARFEAERQAMAFMEHPCIAKIFDGGTTDDGQPYFVMEFINGQPITKYCDKHKLSIRQRLDLFIQVCNAVQHAHQKGVLHRDLKPSNILVAETDGRPIPKIIDFGLAKALSHQSRLTDRTLFTEMGAVIGTIQYMSPEQADLNPIDIDTRSDIYALGVILYELLTGSTPIEEESVRKKAVLQLLQTIREKDPPKPSDRLSASGVSAIDICAQRQINPDRLKSVLKGDLDWIVMKALEKDRSRRYDTANGFAVDIQRYMSDQTVLARPPSTTYRLGKFIQKNRTIVSAISVSTMALTLGLIGTVVGLVESQRNASRLQQATIDLEQSNASLAKSRNEARLQLSRSRLLLAEARWRSGDTHEASKLMRFIPVEHRGLEWKLANRCFEGSYDSFRAHSGPISALIPTLDGQQLITCGSDDGTVRVWDIKSKKQVGIARPAIGRILCARMTIDGERICVIGQKEAVVFDKKLKEHSRRQLFSTPDRMTNCNIVIGSKR